MTTKPTYIDLPSRIYVADKQALRTPSPHELFPPRSGHVPPALSPLDAFALQSRMLAQKLEQGAKFDKRISRLPQFYVAKELAKPRPGYAEQELKPAGEGVGAKANGAGRKKKTAPSVDSAVLPSVVANASRGESAGGT